MEQALFDATTAEQVDLVRELLQNPSINVNWGEKDFDRTALIRACFKGNREIVRLLLNDPRVLINRRQAQGATALNIASQYQQADVLEELLQDPRVDVNLPNDEGGSPFFYACAFGSLPCFRLLLAHPLVRVDQRNNHGTTPFLLACDADVSLEIFDALVTHPDVDVNRGNSQGVTPLHVVAWGSHPTNVRKVRELLKRQANVNAANVGGITPVDRAVQSDSIPILKEMMVSGQVLNIDRISRKNLSKKMAALLQSYQNDREKVIFDLQAEFGHPVQLASYMFGLGVLLSDDYICLRPDTPVLVARFLGIMTRLPLELQILLSLRAHSSGATHISKKRLDHSLKSIFQAFGH